MKKKKKAKKQDATRTPVFRPSFWDPIPWATNPIPPRGDGRRDWTKPPVPSHSRPGGFGSAYSPEELREELLKTPTQLRESMGFATSNRESDLVYSKIHREYVANSFKRIRWDNIQLGSPSPTTAPQPDRWPETKRWLQDGRPELLELSRDRSHRPPLKPMGVLHSQLTSPGKLKELNKELLGYVPYSRQKLEKQWLAEYKKTGLGSLSKAMRLKPMLLDEKTAMDYSRQFGPLHSGQWPQLLRDGGGYMPSANSISPREKSMHESGGPPASSDWYRQQILLDHKRDKSLDTPAVAREMAHYDQLHGYLQKQDKGVRAMLDVFRGGGFTRR